MVPDKHLVSNVPFQSAKYRKKDFCVDNIKTIGDLVCPTCRNEKCVYISTNKMNSFYDCKKCKACCNVFNIPFKDQKPTIIMFGSDGTHCLHESRLRKKIHFHFWRNFSANHHQAHSNLNQKRLKWVQVWNKRIRFLLANDLSNIFISKSFSSFSIYTQPLKFNQSSHRKSWSFQFPTTESSGLSILVPTLLLLQ